MLRYLHLDVFTDRRFEGNQLAVFPSPGRLSTDEMQRIAREMAFSESTFVFPPDGPGDVRMRIFTPGEELPIAGHPTIGSTFALVEDGVIAPGREEFVFGLGVGPTPVSLEWDDGRLAFAWMTMPRPEYGAAVSDRAALAAACGLGADDLMEALPVQVVSCGVPYLLVPLRTRAAVDTVSVDRAALKRCLRAASLAEHPGFFFTVDAASGEVYSRMLAPGFGITEDPATGSASGPLGCYLVHHDVVQPEVAGRLVNLQGVAMGRPSRIYIAIGVSAGAVSSVRVGGKAVLVGRGTLDVD